MCVWGTLTTVWQLYCSVCSSLVCGVMPSATWCDAISQVVWCRQPGGMMLSVTWYDAISHMVWCHQPGGMMPSARWYDAVSHMVWCHQPGGMMPSATWCGVMPSAMWLVFAVLFNKLTHCQCVRSHVRNWFVRAAGFWHYHFVCQ